MAFPIKALRNLVFVKRVESAQKTAGGLFIPDSAQEQELTGEVVACGPGKVKADGTLVAMTVKVGDTILFPAMHGWEAEHEGEEFVILREDDILAIMASK